MTFKEYCLFCGDLSPTLSANLAIPSPLIPNLETFCNYLQIDISKDNKDAYHLWEKLQPYFNGNKQINTIGEYGICYEHQPKLCEPCFKRVSRLAELIKLLEMGRRELKQVILKGEEVTEEEVLKGTSEEDDVDHEKLGKTLKLFVQKSGLKRKVIQETTTVPGRKRPKEQDDLNEQCHKVKCNLCGKEFSNELEMTAHRMIHDMDKRSKANVMDKLKSKLMSEQTSRKSDPVGASGSTTTKDVVEGKSMEVKLESEEENNYFINENDDEEEKDLGITIGGWTLYY